jgi:hypothetical protein
LRRHERRPSPCRPSRPCWSRGNNKPGLGHAVAKAIGDAGINLSFLMVQVVARRYSAVFGFESETDATKALTLIKKAMAPGKK